MQMDHVRAMEADMGGTEIEGVLQCVFSSRSSVVPTAIIVLTDGEVTPWLYLMFYTHYESPGMGCTSSNRRHI